MNILMSVGCCSSAETGTLVKYTLLLMKYMEKYAAMNY
jgi:hypothetical protein